jgi:hypothetical protein
MVKEHKIDILQSCNGTLLNRQKEVKFLKENCLEKFYFSNKIIFPLNLSLGNEVGLYLRSAYYFIKIAHKM